MFKSLQILWFTIMQIKSRIQTSVKPNTSLIRPATSLPSLNLVTNPQIQEVTGMIAKIRLTIQDKPK